MKTRRIKILHCLLLAAITLAPSTLFADTLYLFGRIGNLPIAASLERDGGDLSGWYFYDSKAREIQVSGKIDKGGSFLMDESDNGKKTGVFKGSVSQGHWTGTWQKPDGGIPLQLSLEENHDALKNLKGAFKCAIQERRAQYGYTYKWALSMSVADGNVKKFQSTQGSYVDNKEDQICSMDISDLKQAKSETGILLGTSQAGSGSDNKKCTIRIVGDADTLWVVFGDSSEEGNDCRSTSDTMYCSPRAFWNDIVIDRHMQRCRAVQ